MLSIMPAHIASSSACFVMMFLISFQVYRRPNKLRICIFAYSVAGLVISIINTLQVQYLVSVRVNSFTYLILTLMMSLAHFFIYWDVGNRLRIGESNSRHPLLIVSFVFLVITCALLLTEITILAINADGKQEYPEKRCFIAGVTAAIISVTSVFTYSFKPLLYWRKDRTNEGLSRITAIGIWFFVIQNVWNTLYFALYVWFFAVNSWSYFQTLLAFDYPLRFIESMLYTWPPPQRVIKSLTTRLPNSAITLSTRKSSHNTDANIPSHVMSSEKYNKEVHTAYENNHRGETSSPCEQQSIHSHEYGSKVTIVTR